MYNKSNIITKMVLTYLRLFLDFKRGPVFYPRYNYREPRVFKNRLGRTTEGALCPHGVIWVPLNIKTLIF